MPRHGQLLAVLLLALLALPGYGEEPEAGKPTVGQLVDSIQVLSPNNAKIQNARFTLYSWTDTAKHPMRCDVQWTHGEPVGMLISNTEWQCPFTFLSQNRGIFIIAPNHDLELMENTQPRLVLRRTEDDVLCKIGNNKGIDSRLNVQIDLPDLISRRVEYAAVEEDADGNWIVQTSSSTAGFEVTMTFDRPSPYALKRFEMRSRLTGKVKYALSNISINDDSLPPWPDFPDLKTMPKDFTVNQDGDVDFEGKNIGEVFGTAIDKMKGMIAALGKDMLTSQDGKIADQIDWEAVDKAHQESGPILRQAFGFRPVADQAFPTFQR